MRDVDFARQIYDVTKQRHDRPDTWSLCFDRPTSRAPFVLILAAGRAFVVYPAVAPVRHRTPQEMGARQRLHRASGGAVFDVIYDPTANLTRCFQPDGTLLFKMNGLVADILPQLEAIYGSQN